MWEETGYGQQTKIRFNIRNNLDPITQPSYILCREIYARSMRTLHKMLMRFLCNATSRTVAHRPPSYSLHITSNGQEVCDILGNSRSRWYRHHLHRPLIVLIPVRHLKLSKRPVVFST